MDVAVFHSHVVRLRASGVVADEGVGGWGEVVAAAGVLNMVPDHFEELFKLPILDGDVIVEQSLLGGVHHGLDLSLGSGGEGGGSQ